MPLSLQCEEIIGTQGRGKRARPVFCHDEIGVEPIFTTMLAEVTKENRQPKFYCTKHRRKHKQVSPSNGRPILPVVKSYEVVDAKLVPLRRGR